MKYLILVYSNPESRKAWESFTPAERAEGFRAHADLKESLAASGELIVAEALADPAMAKRVTPRAAGATDTDGPFAEVKEHLAGFYLVDCAHLDRAIEVAARVPEAPLGLVEVRPVMDLHGMEM